MATGITSKADPPGPTTRMKWKGIAEDSEKLLNGLAELNSVSNFRSISDCARIILGMSERDPVGRHRMALTLNNYRKETDAVSERLLVQHGFRFMRALVGQGRMSVTIGDHTYVIE